MKGTIKHLYLKPAHGVEMRPVKEATAETGMGLVGDASFGSKKRQVLLIEKETLDEFELSPGQVRENVVTSGIAMAGLPTGTRLRAGDVTLEITLDCTPCQLIEDIRSGLRSAIKGRRGTLCRVAVGGVMRAGDDVEVVESGEPVKR